MGKLRVIKTGPVSTIQDFGRFGYRRYGIPQSGAMDKDWMVASNRLVGNPDDYPVVEFAILGMKLEALTATTISVVGAALQINGKQLNQKSTLMQTGDVIEISAPTHVYGYLSLGGRLQAQEDFGSVSTYATAGFGGIVGRALQVGDELKADDAEAATKETRVEERAIESPAIIRIMKGPEWDVLKELPSTKEFQVDPSSDRMGIRLIGSKLDCDYREIATSAVIPGTVQLPASGQPIILMNDCQTTGGYPRVGKVIEEDMGRVAQVKPRGKVKLILVEN